MLQTEIKHFCSFAFVQTCSCQCVYVAALCQDRFTAGSTLGFVCMMIWSRCVCVCVCFHSFHHSQVKSSEFNLPQKGKLDSSSSLCWPRTRTEQDNTVGLHSCNYAYYSARKTVEDCAEHNITFLICQL